MHTIKENAVISKKLSEQPHAVLNSGHLPLSKQIDKTGEITGSMVKVLDSVFTILREHKVSLSSCHAIVKLYMAYTVKGETINLSSLASHLGVTTASITGVADGIEKLGFAKRLVNPNDRRAMMICLTPLGIRFAESLGTGHGACE